MHLADQTTSARLRISASAPGGNDPAMWIIVDERPAWRAGDHAPGPSGNRREEDAFSAVRQESSNSEDKRA